MFRFIVPIVVWFLLDLYAFFGLRTVTAKWSPFAAQTTHLVYWGVDILILAIILYFGYIGKFEQGPTKNVSWVFGMIIISIVPKLIVVAVLGIEDVARGMSGLFTFGQKVFGFSEPKDFIPERRTFISQLAFGIAAIPFLGLLYGSIKGKYDYRVHRVRLKFKDLPDAFDGFRITQLSDIHSGSLDDRDAVKRGIELANRQESDLVVFTGDFVNNRADELEEWLEHFGALQARFGKFSILGNHDYGDYVKWPSLDAKQQNMKKLLKHQNDMGFQMLLNSHTRIEKDGQSIVLAGVENWGNRRGFAKYGDLSKALHGVKNEEFTILLSHDPSHWEEVTVKDENHVHLTLSGHTHGMQFGVEIPGFKWSPSQYVYPRWAGLYAEKNRHLYVNRGFGFLGYPGRVGILPEITVIELLKA
ncbi:MAG: metallophosphoesterase [Arcticibacter sp.]